MVLYPIKEYPFGRFPSNHPSHGPFDKPEDADPEHPFYRRENFIFDPNLKMHKVIAGKKYRGKNGEVREVTNIRVFRQPMSIKPTGYGLKTGPANGQADTVFYRVVEGRQNRVGKTGRMFRNEFSKWFKEVV